MKKLVLTLAAGLLLFAPALAAQDQPAVVFGMYMRCNQAMEAQADEAVQEVWGPIIERHVQAGRLSGWLWLTHSQGGAWRRVLATTGTDVGEMMSVREDMVAELGQHPDAMNAVQSACPGHDDYIWMGNTVSTNNPDVMGTASVSSYHMCNRAREGRADEIFNEVLAPLYQKHLDMGHLASYGFYGHRAGGMYRRLETVSGADHATVLSMQAAVYQEATETNPYAMQEFAEICQSHSDYMWTNSTPGS